VFGTVDDGMRAVIDEMIALLYAGVVTNGIIISQKPCNDHTRRHVPHRRRYVHRYPCRGGRVFLPPFVYVSVCFSKLYLKTDATRITKLHTEMFHDTSWKPIYFEVKRSKVKVTSHKNIAGVSFCTSVSDRFFQVLTLFSAVVKSFRS